MADLQTRLVIKIKYQDKFSRVRLTDLQFETVLNAVSDVGIDLETHIMYVELGSRGACRSLPLSETNWVKAYSFVLQAGSANGTAPVVRMQVGLLVGRVSSLAIHPVKSTRAVSLTTATMDSCGFKWDRFMSIIDVNQNIVTQRMVPALAEIFVNVNETDLERITVTLKSTKSTKEIKFPLPSDEPRCKVHLYKAAIEAVDCGDAVSAWLTNLLRRESPTHDCCSPPYRLVKMCSDQVRKCDQSSMAPLCDHAVAEYDQVALADFAPVLLTNLASLEALNAVLPKGCCVPMDRFRPNIVVSPVEGQKPWSEDEWRRIFIGDVELRCITRDPRCVMPTVNQQTGVAGFRTALDRGDDKLMSKFAEPLATLKRDRPWPQWQPTSPIKPPEFGGTGGQPNGLFGIYCGFQHCGESGVMTVGDPVVVLE